MHFQNKLLPSVIGSVLFFSAFIGSAQASDLSSDNLKPFDCPAPSNEDMKAIGSSVNISLNGEHLVNLTVISEIYPEAKYLATSPVYFETGQTVNILSSKGDSVTKRFIGNSAKVREVSVAMTDPGLFEFSYKSETPEVDSQSGGILKSLSVAQAKIKSNLITGHEYTFHIIQNSFGLFGSAIEGFNESDDVVTVVGCDVYSKQGVELQKSTEGASMSIQSGITSG